MVFVSDGAGRTEEICVKTAAVLLPTVASAFGPGILRDSKGCIITVESGDVAGQYAWTAIASGEGNDNAIVAMTDPTSIQHPNTI